MTGKAKSNLSRTLRTMEAYGLVALDRGAGGRIRPRITHDRVALDLPLVTSSGVAERRPAPVQALDDAAG